MTEEITATTHTLLVSSCFEHINVCWGCPFWDLRDITFMGVLQTLHDCLYNNKLLRINIPPAPSAPSLVIN